MDRTESDWLYRDFSALEKTKSGIPKEALRRFFEKVLPGCFFREQKKMPANLPQTSKAKLVREILERTMRAHQQTFFSSEGILVTATNFPAEVHDGKVQWESRKIADKILREIKGKRLKTPHSVKPLPVFRCRQCAAKRTVPKPGFSGSNADNQ